MKNTSRLHGTLGRFLGRLLAVSLTVWTLGVMYAPAWAAVTVDQQPLIIQKSEIDQLFGTVREVLKALA